MTDRDRSAEPGESALRPRAVTGLGGSDPERRAAERLARELEGTGRAVQILEARVRAGQMPTVTLHAAVAVAGSLIGLASPIAGAAIVLLAAFSFYGERGLGLFLFSRILPRRHVRNVISPPLGPEWEHEVDTIVAAGYDAPRSYPAGAWLDRSFGGRLTTERLLFWGGMIPAFAVLMARTAGAGGVGIQLVQIAATTIMLAVIAAQADRRLQGEPVGVGEDLAAAREVIAAIEELGGTGDAGVAACLFGAESDGAAGAEAFYSDPGLKVKDKVTVIGLVTAATGARPQATAREGDLSGVAMSFDLAEGSPAGPEPVAIRRDTAAGRARRRQARAVTLVGRGESGRDFLLDVIEAAAPGRDTT